MRAIIVDDEDAVRETTRIFLELYAKDIEVLEECSSVAEGYEAICRQRPDLVLLDIEMPDGTGFDLLSKFSEVTFEVIFITGHNDYAIKAFKFSAVDYLLKPLDPEDLINALDRLRKNRSRPTQQLKWQALLEKRAADQLPSKIVLSDADNLYLVETNEIVRCQSEGNYTHFFLADGRELLISRTLKEYDELLSGDVFFRTHQSHLINLNFLKQYSKKEGGYIVMKDDSEIPLAVRKRETLMNALRNIG